jgi:hypothetical protein
MARKRKCEDDIRQSDEAVQRLSAEYEQLTQDAAALNYGLEQVISFFITTQQPQGWIFHGIPGDLPLPDPWNG